MDARAEAVRRYPNIDDTGPFDVEESHRAAFVAGAAWALREFGDALFDQAARERWPASDVLSDWSVEAHDVADGIEDA